MKSVSKLRVLVTGGPVSVPIDDVRVITNTSTGEMGRLLANACAARSWAVTLLEGAATTLHPLDPGVTTKKFFSYDDLARCLSRALTQKPDIVIHAAAVADFAPARKITGKISSGNKLTLPLKPLPKLIDTIKRAAPSCRLIGFKLEPALNTTTCRKAAALLQTADCARVVANEQQGRGYKAIILRPDGSRTRQVCGKPALVSLLMKEIERP